jgi:hypothetical protein
MELRGQRGMVFLRADLGIERVMVDDIVSVEALFARYGDA